MRITNLFTVFLFFCWGCSNHVNRPAIVVKPASKSWLGKWSRQVWQNDAGLEIKAVRGDSMEFSLFAQSGGHTGELEGVAVVVGNTATFLDAEEADTCLLVFTLHGDSVIAVEQKKGSCFAGMGVFYDGNYRNERLIHKEVPEKSMFNLGMLNSETEDSVFRMLVKEGYQLFVNSTQLVGEEEDLDSLGVQVKSAGVRGMYTYMENIVMVDSAMNVWAAVIDNDTVYYYTNHNDYKDRLPKTIDVWRERFKDYIVVYR
jgi:hypothetical protein